MAEFQCPNCNNVIIAEVLAGAEVLCPQCNNTVIAPETEEEPTGLDVVMSALATHLPSWGTSVVFHLALILLCIFLVWADQQMQEDKEYQLAFVKNAPMRIQKRALPPGPKRKVKSVTPDATTFTTMKGEKSAPKGAPLNPISVSGTRGSGAAGVEGGTGRGFMGIPSGGGGGGGGAQNIVYVIDGSGSMTDSIDFVKAELKRSIGELNVGCRFHVIFFSAGKPMEMPARRLVPASRSNKASAFKFINSIVAGNPYAATATDPTLGLERAFAMKPQLIYFLTDGEFDKTVLDMISRWNRGRQVAINTISFIYRSGERLLRRIAKENKGIYRFVSEDDLITLFR